MSLEDSIARSWTIPFWTTCSFLLTFGIYMRGWLLARVTRPGELPAWRVWCFGSGLFSFWLAIASPIDPLGSFLLSAHMAQHFIMMFVAPPLIVLGAPSVPFLRGVPRSLVREIMPPWASMGWPHKLAHFFMHPATGWLGMNLAYVGWHLPAAYQLALRSTAWHEVEHACFFFTSILFWWTIIRPWPSHSRYSPWLIVPSMLAAGTVGSIVSASLAFSGHVVYPIYAEVPRLFGISALQDQIAGGVGMWVIGSIFLLAPAMVIVFNLLSTKRRRPQRFVILNQQAPPQSFDLLRVRGIGAFLRFRYGRLMLQGISFTIVAAVIADGFVGHPMGAMNIAGILPWNVARVFGVLALLFVGNLFCMVCPFMLPRELARLIWTPRMRWPIALRRKWISLSLMLLFFWAYEQWSLWDGPRRTAIVLSIYIAAALLIDSIFEGASFCKYVCPIGQINFIGSLLSPLEVTTRSVAVCNSCTTRDCINGNASQRGCELELYLPQKVGNLDCTMCMDCVKACPHDNIEIGVHSPLRALLSDPVRASIGRLSHRWDVAALALTVTFGSFAVAAVMVSPVVTQLERLQELFRVVAPLLSPGASIITFVLALSAGAFLLAKCAQRYFAATPDGVREIFCGFSLALLPLGFTMWAAHLIFHLGGGVPALLPAAQQMAGDFMSLTLSGTPVSYPLGVPHWAMSSFFNPDTLRQCQFVLLEVGLLASLYAGWRLAVRLTSQTRQSVALWSVWAITLFLLYGIGAWILIQPMEMRGMLM